MMDNMSGSVNWTVQDEIPIKEIKQIEVKEKIPYVKPDLTELDSFTEKIQSQYMQISRKELGDVLVHLNVIKTILSK